MSYITKRERVFNEYQLSEVPARNEGKLKAFASSTDTRAWSHQCSDQAEHLVELMKRNSRSCAPHVVPTAAIVDTLMAGKNAALRRLTRRVRLLQEMLLAYGDLDLTCDQKCEIARAHADIKAASKNWNQSPSLNSSFATDVSDTYETGKSGGDSYTGQESKAAQINAYTSEKSTYINDPRIQDMQDTIVNKDAKLNAMQNTIEVMESDSCEPYCIYAHIYTALEKIFGILNQNPKYRQYLELLSAGKDIRDVDIKAKIMIKIKIFEKFCVALLAPCSAPPRENAKKTCCCYAQISPSYKCTYACTTIEKSESIPDSKRCKLVADIMEHEEMKEILDTTEVNSDINDEPTHDKEKIDQDNLTRLKNLQANYNDLMTFYENLKHEKNCLVLRCHRYIEMEEELEYLKSQLREYNTVWNEKEYYKKRSDALDNLKQEYYILADEASSLENELKADKEICYMKSRTIEELKTENLVLEKKLHDTTIAFEKEKNNLLCKLKECDCKIMCHEQQIRSLSGQIDTLLEHDQDQQNTNIPNATNLLNDMEFLKSEMIHLRELLRCSEDEKRNLNEQIEEKINVINALKDEIEKWKITYEDTLRRNYELEKHIEQSNEDLNNYLEENKSLRTKTTALETLNDTVNSKLLEIEKLNNELDQKNTENYNLQRKLLELQSLHNTTLKEQNDVSQKISRELLDKTKSYELLYKDYEKLTGEIIAKNEEVDNLNKKVLSFMNTNSILSQDNTRLAKELSQKETEIDEVKCLIESLEASTNEEHDLLKKDMSKLAVSLKLAESNSNELIQKNKSYEDVLKNTQKDYENFKLKMLCLQDENNLLKSKLNERDSDISLLQNKQIEKDNLIESLTQDNAAISLLCSKLKDELQSLKTTVQNIISEKNKIQEELHDKQSEIESKEKALSISQKESSSLFNEVEKYKDVMERFDRIKKQDLDVEKENLTKELSEKNMEIEQLQQFLKSTEKDLSEISTQANEFTKLDRDLKQTEKRYNSLTKDYDKLQKTNEELQTCNGNLIKDYNYLISEKDSLQNDLANKLKDLSDLNDLYKNSVKENCHLRDQIQNLEQSQSKAVKDIINLEKDIFGNDANFDVIQENSSNANNGKENSKYEDLKANFDQLTSENVTLKEEKEMNTHKIHDLQTEIAQLRMNLDNMNAVSSTNTEILSQNNSVRDPNDEISKKVSELQREKMQCQNKIRELRDQLDLYDENINTLREDIAQRDDRIAVLQNYINGLEEEVKVLHKNLEGVIEVGEQLRDARNVEIADNLKLIDDHHSKAKYNIQMELDNLNKDNNLPEQSLTTAHIQSEIAPKERNQYLSEMQNLNNERGIVLNEVKDLELSVTGETILSTDNCDIVSIVEALDNIRKSFDEKMANNSSLQNTLLKVQTSSHLILSKAEEAKRLMENEKFKILNEKEQAVRDKLLTENYMNDVQKQLEHQISMDEATIKNLEYELMNQKFIMDKYSEATQLHIMQLKNELENLHNLYNSALTKIEELENKVNKEKSPKDLISKASSNLHEKVREIMYLKQELKENVSIVYRNVTTQTNKDNIEKYDDSSKNEAAISVKDSFSINLIESQLQPIMSRPKSTQKNLGKESDQIYYNIPSYTRQDSALRPMQEIQIFTANVEPTFEGFMQKYINYKVKHLSTGPIENHTFSSQLEDLLEINKLNTDSYNADLKFSNSYDNNELISQSKASNKIPKEGLLLIYSSDALPSTSYDKNKIDAHIKDTTESKIENNYVTSNQEFISRKQINVHLNVSPVTSTADVLESDPNDKYNIVDCHLNKNTSFTKSHEAPSKPDGIHTDNTNISKDAITDDLKGANSQELDLIDKYNYSRNNFELLDKETSNNKLSPETTYESNNAIKSKRSEVAALGTKNLLSNRKVDITNIPYHDKSDEMPRSHLQEQNINIESNNSKNNSNLIKKDDEKDEPFKTATNITEDGEYTEEILLPDTVQSQKKYMDKRKSDKNFKINERDRTTNISNTENSGKPIRFDQTVKSKNDVNKSKSHTNQENKNMKPLPSSTNPDILPKGSDQIIYSQDKKLVKSTSEHDLDSAARNQLNVSKEQDSTAAIGNDNSVKFYDSPIATENTMETYKDSTVVTSYDKKINAMDNNDGNTALKNSSFKHESDGFTKSTIKTDIPLISYNDSNAIPSNVFETKSGSNDDNSSSRAPTYILDSKKLDDTSNRRPDDNQDPYFKTLEGTQDLFSHQPKPSDTKMHDSLRQDITKRQLREKDLKANVNDSNNISTGVIENDNQRKSGHQNTSSNQEQYFEETQGTQELLAHHHEPSETIIHDNLPRDESTRKLRENNITDHYTSGKLNVHDNDSFTKEKDNKGVLVTTDLEHYYKNKISALENELMEKEQDCKRKIEAFKKQYDANIKDMIYKHNQGVRSIQSLHEETLQDFIKTHEDEVENLRSMSIEAMKKADIVEKEKVTLLRKLSQYDSNVDEKTFQKFQSPISSHKRLLDTSKLSQTKIEAFNVKPKSLGPCSCYIDGNLSDTIKNIFDKVDIEQRRSAEQTYLKYIAKKLLSENIDSLDCQELSYLHLKVCRTWKSKVNKEEALQEKITILEQELMNKQRNAHQHIAELDKKLAEERVRLQEVRDRVCCAAPGMQPCHNLHGEYPKHYTCLAGDMELSRANRCRRVKQDPKMAGAARAEGRDEVPTRLRRQDRPQRAPRR